MSRKTNRLRNRLRIQGEQHAAREERLIAGEKALTERDREMQGRMRDLNALQEKLKKQAALRIVIEQSYAQAGDLYQVAVSFYPRAFIYNMQFNPKLPMGGLNSAANVDREAAYIAEDVAQRVRQGLIDFAKGELGGVRR